MTENPSPLRGPAETFDQAHATFNRYESAGCTIVEANGEIDMAAAPMLSQALAGASTPFVVLDLSQTRFLDSTGLSVLVEHWREAPSAGGWLRLVNPNGPVLKVLQVTGTDQILPVHDTVDEVLALRAVESAGADQGAEAPKQPS